MNSNGENEMKANAKCAKCRKPIHVPYFNLEPKGTLFYCLACGFFKVKK